VPWDVLGEGEAGRTGDIGDRRKNPELDESHGGGQGGAWEGWEDRGPWRPRGPPIWLSSRGGSIDRLKGRDGKYEETVR
jgi:hypothetical protein